MTNNSSNQDFTNNTDGFTLGGGTTKRKITVTNGDVTVTGGGSNDYTMPVASDTLVGRSSTDNLTNKTIDGNLNTITNLGPSTLAESVKPGFAIGIISKTILSTTGNKAITGLGFTPKLVRFTALAASDGSNANAGMGAMTASSQYWTSIAANSTGNHVRNAGSDAAIAYLSAGSVTPLMKASYVSMDNGGFTINVTSASSAFDVAYEAYA